MERLGTKNLPDGFVSLWSVGHYFSVHRWQVGRGTLQLPYPTLEEAMEAFSEMVEEWS